VRIIVAEEFLSLRQPFGEITFCDCSYDRVRLNDTRGRERRQKDIDRPFGPCSVCKARAVSVGESVKPATLIASPKSIVLISLICGF
jgi:hypothetical protein